jgi:hypothetical protein
MSNWPRPPKNVFITPSFVVGAVDIRFDNPIIVPQNASFEIMGVDIWKSYEGPRGQFIKLNDFPIGSLTYRDATVDVEVPEEDVTSQFLSRGQDENLDWVFRVRKRPMIRPESQHKYASYNEDIEVKIYDPDTDSMVRVPVAKVRGDLGEVKLIDTAYYDPETSRLVKPILPDFSHPKNKVTCTYRWGSSLVTLRLLDRSYYKISTVARDTDGNVVTTPLDEIEPATILQQEELDWIWRRALEYQQFMLDQGGEPVFVFLRKWFGQRCPCFNFTRNYADNRCEICYGTGWVRGYEGPFEVDIAPPSGVNSIEFDDKGYHQSFNYETWMLDRPLIRTFDFMVRSDGTRFVVSRPQQAFVRGRILQQNFSLEFIDEYDIRYKVPLDPSYRKDGPVPPEWDGRGPRPEPGAPLITNNLAIFDNLEQKGRSIPWENLA